MSRNYPISSQYLPKLIANNAIYVDKTSFIVSLLTKKNNAAYFLSRPRRFGKSLFVSALEQVFLGKKEFFKETYIYDKHDWEIFPVIRFSLDKLDFAEVGLEAALFAATSKVGARHQLALHGNSAKAIFENLIEQLYDKYQKKVVILIDEYDKPIIHGIEKDDSTVAEKNRDILKSFYGVLKDSDQYLRFTFITGVSRFAKVSIFSDLNHLDDLTLDSRYAAICGFTEAEIRYYCADGLQDLADKEGKTVEAIMDKIRFWYNGFSWNAKDFVYNPYSTMLLMHKQVFDIYWFDTATPTFLVKLIHKHYEYNFKNLQVEKGLYHWHDLRNLNYVSIMLQTGYLTFKQHIVDDLYEVGYPNNEVSNAFSKMLLGSYLHQDGNSFGSALYKIETALRRNDLNEVIQTLTAMFKILPSQFFWEDAEKVDKKGNVSIVKRQVGESFYHAIIYLIFNILSIRMKVEIPTSVGRIDAIVETDTHVYLFEFKKDRKAKAAIQQIWQNQYANLYSLSKKQIVCIGMCFTIAKKGVSDAVFMNLEAVEAYLA
jgi:Predicted AAA-ATPase/PD-(D/E)XK nuclease superfamily